MRKTNKIYYHLSYLVQTDRQTPLKTLPLPLPLVWVKPISLGVVFKKWPCEDIGRLN